MLKKFQINSLYIYIYIYKDTDIIFLVILLEQYKRLEFLRLFQHFFRFRYNSFIIGGARGVMVIVIGNEHGDRVQILDEIDYISHSTNTLGNGMNPIILPPAMGKFQGRLGSSAFVRLI